MPPKQLSNDSISNQLGNGIHRHFLISSAVLPLQPNIQARQNIIEPSIILVKLRRLKEGKNKHLRLSILVLKDSVSKKPIVFCYNQIPFLVKQIQKLCQGPLCFFLRNTNFFHCFKGCIDLRSSHLSIFTDCQNPHKAPSKFHVSTIVHDTKILKQITSCNQHTQLLFWKYFT